MESLSKYQHMVLRKLANGRTKIYVTMSGLPGEAGEDKMNIDFNSILRLVELKLVSDATAKHAELVAKYNPQGRDLVVVNLTNGGQWMFERVSWENWVN